MHLESDELFYVVSGSLTTQLHDGNVVPGPGDIFVVSRGVEHCPLALEETAAVMVEVKGTLDTGDGGGDRTVSVRELGNR